MPTADRRLPELYRRYGPLIHARCRRLLRDDAAAEDATQEVFLRVWRHLDAAQDDRQALAWMYRVSTNHCLNVLRASGRLRTEAEAPLPEVEAEGFEQALEDQDLALRLLMRAPEPLRAPALLHWVDGLEQGQVAQVLGVSRRTVINRLQEFAARARKYLAREGVRP